MHPKNIVPNDLKFGSVLVGPIGDAKIIDFGLSCISGVAEVVVNTKKMEVVHWKSPEYLGGKRPSVETVIYSLAMCILELLTDDVPWGRNMLAAVVCYNVNKGSIPKRPKVFSDQQWNLIELMTKSVPAQRVKCSFVVDKLLEIISTDRSSLSVR